MKIQNPDPLLGIIIHQQQKVLTFNHKSLASKHIPLEIKTESIKSSKTKRQKIKIKNKHIPKK